MTQPLTTALAAAVLGLASTAALAQSQSVYIGGGFLEIHSKADPLRGPATPDDARLDVGDARTIVFGYQRYFTDNWGMDLVLGIPPKHKVYGRGALEGFGQIASSKQLAPTVFATYRFGQAGDRFRPFVGLGINYTHFTDTRSTTGGNWASGGPTRLKLSDSIGPAAQVGASYMLDERWSINASVVAAKVKSDLKATTDTPQGRVVRRTEIDFRPLVFTVTVGYHF
ncbi:outer membrane beta-barrel protein [Caldimonas thermodepolymerans]|jgi:outer membrane protein|uniref:OmpW family protein n=1 Tax=Caldimonas thermodepolymerans TaxID=215580 RepID=A0A2S5T7Z5_9BURK|nr:OmpW family outer membrane protein [Caldimonas thermodepolymerans]PPE71042.1 OmpW family protein [Caldimonas thermodepolymerans]QPC31344.1 outer membrane beta-barrel protein [Caldimonas thermodepolymerans]RDH99690.1 outer membrane protein [Caldimonas thermodepolymerans]TCP07584.1 outer membrane protein [Caldimonas thermodepolymerans]UZG44089.1 outer membrane beta-barrel protein [Caldimonas thermodepolymerans]